MKGSFTALLRVEGSDPDHLEAQLDRVMEELVRLGVEDPAIGGTLTTGEVEISITVDAESLDEAVPKAISTSGWPGFGRRRPTGPLRVDWEKLTLVPA